MRHASGHSRREIEDAVSYAEGIQFEALALTMLGHAVQRAQGKGRQDAAEFARIAGL